MTLTNELTAIMNKQKHYFLSGVTRSYAFRCMMLDKLYNAVRKYEKEIADALQKDLGKHPFESYATETGFVLSSIAYMKENLADWMEPEKVKTPLHLQPASSYIIKEPYGSVLVIGPFNYPVQLLLDPLAGSIAAGNCTVLKPSEDTPAAAAVIKKIVSEIFPEEFVAVAEGGKETAERLLAAPFDYVFFTGSARVGKIVMEACAKQLIPLTLELGGKSPAVVDHTADLKKAAEKIVWGKFLNAGQTCVAPDYVLADHSVYGRLLEEIERVIKRFYGKNPQSSKDYGRIVNERHFSRLTGIIEQEQHYIAQGGNYEREELYIEPTVLALPHFKGASMEEELFGPILPVIPYNQLSDAVQQIRTLPKPLAAYIFTEDEGAADYFIASMPFGGGCVNDTVSHVGNIHLPFGGVGASGMNHYHGKASFETFSHTKSIMKKSTAVNLPVAYPPYKGKLPVVKKFLR